MERIGIYGGTFSPVHKGHVHAALSFYRAMQLDKLLLIPTAVPPHKKAVVGATDADRLEMLRLSFEHTDAYREGCLSISDFELLQQGKSYTYYTLKHFSKENRELYFLMGTDMFLTLDTWYHAEDLFRLAGFVLMRREKDDALTEQIREKKQYYEKTYGGKIIELATEPFCISSHEIRQKIRNGESTAGLLEESVRSYIVQKHLYGKEE